MTTSILLFFAIACGLLFLLRLARIGALLAFLLAGIIAGPYGLGIFELSDLWGTLGRVGIIFLWFTLGLEINMKRLWSMRQGIFGLGAPQVLMVAVMLFPILFGVTGWSIMGTIMAAILLSMSSTSTDLGLLADRNELQTDMGRQAFSILLFQDLLAIPLMAMLPIFAGRTINLGGNLIDIIVMSVGLILGAVIFGRVILNPFLRLVAKLKSKEATLMAVMLLIIGLAWGVQFTGLPAGLGAFLAGMLLSETIYRHQIKADISPYAIMFMAFFFITLGMGLPLRELAAHWPIILGGLVGLVALKFAAIYIVARVRHVARRDALVMALILAQGGEFGLLILQTMKTNGIEAIPAMHAEILTAIILLSIMMTPLLLGIYDFVRRRGKIGGARARKINKKTDGPAPAVIVCGFGRVGQIIVKMLETENIPYVAIDMDVDAVIRGRDDGHNVFFGDTSNTEVLRDLGLAPRKTRAVVVALNNTWNAKSTIRAVHNVSPRVQVFARARDLDESEILRGEGAVEALPETIESSFRLGFSVLERVGIAPVKIRDLLHSLRADNYEKLG